MIWFPSIEISGRLKQQHFSSFSKSSHWFSLSIEQTRHSSNTRRIEQISIGMNNVHNQLNRKYLQHSHGKATIKLTLFNTFVTAFPFAIHKASSSTHREINTLDFMCWRSCLRRIRNLRKNYLYKSYQKKRYVAKPTVYNHRKTTKEKHQQKPDGMYVNLRCFVCYMATSKQIRHLFRFGWNLEKLIGESITSTRDIPRVWFAFLVRFGTIFTEHEILG